MENLNELLLELEEFNQSSGENVVISSNLENLIEYIARTGKYIFPWLKVRKLFVYKLKSVLNTLNAPTTTHNSNASVLSSTLYASPSSSTSTIFNVIDGSTITMSTSSSSTSLTTTMSESVCNATATPIGEAAAVGPITTTSTTITTTSVLTETVDSLKDIKDRIIERLESFNNAPFTIQRISELLLKPNSNYKKTEKYLRGLEKCVMVVTTVDPNGNKIFIENIMPDSNEHSANLNKQLTPKIPTPFISRDENTSSSSLSNLDVTNNTNNESSSSSSSSPSPPSSSSSSSSSSLNTTIEQEEATTTTTNTGTKTIEVMVTQDITSSSSQAEVVLATTAITAITDHSKVVEEQAAEHVLVEAHKVDPEEDQEMDHSGNEISLNESTTKPDSTSSISEPSNPNESNNEIAQ